MQALTLNLESFSFAAYPIVFLAGVLISFTPCLYPLIPIIVSYVGGKREKTRARSFWLSFFYVLGVSVTYAALGLFASLTGKLFGQIQANPFIYIFVANIIILMGLSMLDVFTLPLPSFFQNPKAGEKTGGSLSGAFSFGLASGLIVAPCMAPVLAALLAYTASRQNLFFGSSLLFTFALGMGVVLILVGTFAGVLFNLPKSGKWQLIIKKILGWSMIVLGQYFLIQAGRLML